ncbi:MAG: alpha/beta fold hydrolase [Acidobacteria bacterium]|nr:alpha/beta fold hydrolase [Acidobacteriota bacterium]
MSVLTHRAQGSGPPILLLNGGMMSIAAWDPMATPLEGRYRVIRCDFRGQLLTPGPPPPTVAGHAADVIALVDALGLNDVHAVGTSFGALVGLVLAADHPARVRSLTAIAATDRITDEMWVGSMALGDACLRAANGSDRTTVFDLLEPATFSPEWRTAQADALRARRQAVSLLPASWFADAAGILSSLQGLNLRADLARIRCPACIVAGECDVTFPVAHSRELASQIRGAVLEVVPRAWHGLVVEQAALAASIVDRFVSGIENRRD